MSTRGLLLIALRSISAMIGFIAAVSFMRAQSGAYNFYMNRLVGNRFNFGTEFSVLLLVLCLILFAISIWLRKDAVVYPLRRVDYLFLVILCAGGFSLCWQFTWTAFLPRWDVHTSFFNYLVTLPFIAYCFVLIAFGELVARLRDKNLVKTMYWVEFFHVYSIWKPIGFIALVLIIAQIIFAILYFPATAVMVISVLVIGVFTYFAVHMINLADEYEKISADKVRSERFKSELITNVSHDIKTPLTSIINYVDLLNNEGLQGQAQEYVQVLARKSERLKILIDDLMEASKAGTGNLRVETGEINIAEIIGQVAGEFEDSFSARDLTLVIRANEGIKIHADSRHLYRALENLFSNAVKYSLSGTRVFAETTPWGDRLLFALQNTSALPIEDSGEELAQQFIRGEKARNTEGSGLGLYIAKSLVELMGGKFRIHAIGDLFRAEIEFTLL